MTCKKLVCREGFPNHPHQNACCSAVSVANSDSASLVINDQAGITEVFELAKVAAKNRLINFSSRGLCMYPALKPGRSLSIEPKKAGEIRVGDIAVFRRSDYLFAHRVIDKGVIGVLPYIITRADTENKGDDGLSFDKDILGIVSGKKDKEGKLDKKESTPAVKVYLKLRLMAYLFKKQLVNSFIQKFSYIQSIRFYRVVADKFFLGYGKRISFVLRVPLNSKVSSRFFQDISREELKELIGQVKQVDHLVKWVAVAYRRSKLMGTAFFLYKLPDCQLPARWAVELKIRIRYRGIGLEEHLLKEAQYFLNASESNELFISFSAEDKIGIEAAKRLGFREMPICVTNIFGTQRCSIHKPVIMRRYQS